MSIRDTWRAAALTDVRQFYANKRGEAVAWNRDKRPDRLTDDAECGITLLPSTLKEPLYFSVMPVLCPVCGAEDLILYVIAHLNDVHQWTWLDFANKFPPILPEDLADSSYAGLLP